MRSDEYKLGKIHGYEDARSGNGMNPLVGNDWILGTGESNDYEQGYCDGQVNFYNDRRALGGIRHE